MSLIKIRDSSDGDTSDDEILIDTEEKVLLNVMCSMQLFHGKYYLIFN